MFCSKCGGQNKDDARFCFKCGELLTAEVNPNNAPIPVNSNLQGATVLTLDTPTLLQVIQTANSLITPYYEAKNSDIVAVLNEPNTVLLQLKKGNRDVISDLDEFCDFCERNSYWGIPQAKDFKKILDGKIPFTLTPNKMLKICEENRIFERYIENRCKPYEDTINANIQYVNLIPPNYRYPLALDEIYSYLVNFKAESWKEAVNLFDTQLHRWQLEANSEEALLIQAQTAVLAGKASSRAGMGALFSGLNLFFK